MWWIREKSACIEVRHEELVDKLKGKLWSDISTNEEEACLEVEDTREWIDDEFALDARDKHFEEREEDKESGEDIESEEDVEMEESEEEWWHEESEENHEHENEDSLCRLFDGQCLIVVDWKCWIMNWS